MADRRKDVRAVVRLQVEDRDARLQRVPLYISSNISIGGIFLITKDPLPEGTEINLKFSLPQEEQAIQVTGRVVWARDEPQSPSHQPGMGIRFIKISSKQRELISRFVEETAG